MEEKFDQPFEDLLENLADPEATLMAALVYRLSEPAPAELITLEALWPQVTVERRRLVMSRLVETSEVSIEVNYSDIALLALKDEDATVRKHGIKVLWEDMHPQTMHRILRLLETDADSEVRETAAQALGRFVLAGELGDINASLAKETEDALLRVLMENTEPMDVRRRALESISYSGRAEVPDLIREAESHTDIKMRASAIFAMGRSADERWKSEVMEALHSPEPEIRYEAARAAGELMLMDSVPQLIKLSRENDREIQLSAVWSLGEIGGKRAQQALMDLADQADAKDDNYLLEAIEDAMNVAALSTGNFVTYVFSMDEDDLLDDSEDLP